MKLILLYGAPGTGKYTVAIELARNTGYTLFHNHVILNALSDIFGFNHPVRRKLEKEFRLRVIEEAVDADINIIITGVIMKDNEAFYRQMLNVVGESGGECFLVHLTASKDVLEERIENDSRKSMNKISSKERLQEWYEQYPESFEEIEFNNQITLDTGELSSIEASSEIIKTFSLS